MSITKKDIKKSYPLPVYNFKVKIDSDTYSFAQVSGLTMQYETVTYRHGLSWLEGDTHITGRQQPINIILERGVVGAKSILWDWFNELRKGNSAKKDVVIELCDEKGEPVVSWTVRKALPTQLEAPTFSAASNEVAVEKLHLIGNGLSMEPFDISLSGLFSSDIAAKVDINAKLNFNASF